jgi:hypothetical protein
MGAPKISNPLENPLATMFDVATFGEGQALIKKLTPDLPPPPGLDEAPTAANQAAKLEAAQKQQANRQGRASTILSGRSGTMLPSASRTLMGGS